MKTTEYFDIISRCLDYSHPQHESTQVDGRIRRWAQIEEAGGRWLRVVVLADGETVHNAFFDRGFEP